MRRAEPAHPQAVAAEVHVATWTSATTACVCGRRASGGCVRLRAVGACVGERDVGAQCVRDLVIVSRVVMKPGEPGRSAAGPGAARGPCGATTVGAGQARTGA